MKKMDLSTTDGQFKIDDTNTALHFTATIDGQPQSFPASDSLVFQIKKDNTYIQPAKGTADGDRVLLQSKDLKHLAVGQYELELWHTNYDGTTDIFPDDGFLPIKVNQNAVGTIGETVTNITMEQLQSSLQQQVKAQVQAEVQKAVSALPKPKDGTDGHDGIDGQTPTLSIGPVDQLPAGSIPKVKEYGAGNDHIWGFSFPQASIETKTITTGSLKDYKSTALCIGSGVGTDAPTQHRFTLMVIADSEGGSQHLTDLTNGQSWDRTFDSNGFTNWRQVTQWN